MGGRLEHWDYRVSLGLGGNSGGFALAVGSASVISVSLKNISLCFFSNLRALFLLALFKICFLSSKGPLLTLHAYFSCNKKAL